MPRQRLDVFLVIKGFQPTRARARWAIEKGLVWVNGKVATRPSLLTDEHDDIKVSHSMRFVSQGGYKLEKALIDFNIDLHGKTVLDIGSSTGGFTDCALQYGAKTVFAVDVGTNQLHESLRADPRVVSYENCDIRKLEPENLFMEKADCITVDVSFIALKHIFPCLRQFLAPGGLVILLIKPQFEAGKQFISRNGLVKNPEAHRMVLNQILTESAAWGFVVKNLTWAPLEKRKNIEYLAVCQPEGTTKPDPVDLTALVQKAFAEKNKLFA